MARTNLDREEYIEQAYFFRALSERLKQNSAAQELLVAIREEVLSTTKLPLAIDFMASELRHHGVFATAMAKLGHYFTPFQTFLISEAENERGRFDLGVALRVLYEEANYRTGSPTQSGIFVFQFETISRNRLGYDRGLAAVADDPIFDGHWREWILSLRRQIGIVDFADLVYVNSEYYHSQRRQRGQQDPETERPPLFGEQEGRIALANRRKDPLLLFSALQRHLGYPAVPRPQPAEDPVATMRGVSRRIDKLELRLKLLEDENRGGIDLSKFYTPRPGEDEAPEPD